MYKFNPKAGRYYDSSGRFVSRDKVIAAVDLVVAKTKVRLRAQVRLLNSGKIPLGEFQDRIGKIIKDAHLQTAMIGAGGKQGMTPRRRGYVGGIVNTEYRRINRMAESIAAGELTAKQLYARMDSYGENVRSTYFWNEQQTKQQTGTILAKRLLTPGVQHCAECILHERTEWVPLRLIVPIGTQCSCRGRCRCVIYYRTV